MSSSEDIIAEAERVLKLLQSGEVSVSQQGAYSEVKISSITTEKGKTRSGEFPMQFGAYFVLMRSNYENMRGFHSEWALPSKADVASKFVAAYRWGETYHLFEVGEVKRLKAEVESVTSKLVQRERELTEKEVALGKAEEKVRFLEKTLTDHGISLGGEQGSVS